MPDVPDQLNVLLVGGGGREHALAWKLRQSPRVRRLFTTHPQNPGLASLAEPVDVPIEKTAFRINRFCEANAVNLVLIGPETPLADGLADKLAAPGRAIVGPGAAAQLEASKSWSKRLMRAASIPTAESRVFTSARDACAYLQTRESAHVVKVSGLAAGKGVVVADSLDQALDAVDQFMVRRIHGDAGAEVIIEEKLDGPECSVFALVDGRNILLLETCQDHKRLLDGDLGPNTGGMGAYCPATILDDATMRRVQREVLVPAVDALRREGVTYRGVLFVGLILTHAGPKVLEFNVRFGDPECQSLMVRLQSDLAELLWRTADGSLDEADLHWDARASCCIVLSSAGYPADPTLGQPITGLEDAEQTPDVLVFHAGTRIAPDAGLVTAGGRVLNVVALGHTIADAPARALEAAEKIHFNGMHYRRDIGARAAGI